MNEYFNLIYLLSVSFLLGTAAAHMIHMSQQEWEQFVDKYLPDDLIRILSGGGRPREL